MLITIEDFNEEYFDEIIKILERSFQRVIFRYTPKEKEFAKEIILDEFLSSPAKVSKFCGVIRAGASLNGNESFHLHDNTRVGIQTACELVRDIENTARTAGNYDFNIYTLSDWSKRYREPFKGYDIISNNLYYPSDKKSDEKYLRVTWLGKPLK